MHIAVVKEFLALSVLMRGMSKVYAFSYKVVARLIFRWQQAVKFVR